MDFKLRSPLLVISSELSPLQSPDESGLCIDPNQDITSSLFIITKTAEIVAAEHVGFLNLGSDYDVAGREFTILNKCALRNVPFDGNLTRKD